MSKKKTHITPMQAIRKKCLWCAGGSRTEVRLCPATSCPLHEYRGGKRPENATITPLQAIKAKCRDCCGLTWADVQKCPGLKLADGPCSLHPFREGANPNISAETRARQRAAMERRLLAEKCQSSPLVETSEIDGRGFVQAEVGELETDHPLFNPMAADNPLQAGR